MSPAERDQATGFIAEAREIARLGGERLGGLVAGVLIKAGPEIGLATAEELGLALAEEFEDAIGRAIEGVRVRVAAEIERIDRERIDRGIIAAARARRQGSR